MAKDAAVFIRLKDGNLVCLIPNVSEQVATVCRNALDSELPQNEGDYVVAVGGKVKEPEAKRLEVPEAAQAPLPKEVRPEMKPPPSPKTYPHPPTKRFKPKKKGR
jgi:hypothetical protein